MRKGWIRTYRGNYVNCLEPDPETIDPVDIAHHLSLENRWGGATQRPYSIAEHSIWVARFARKMVDAERADAAVAWGLLHDAHEAYIKDVPTPLRGTLTSEDYELSANALDVAIMARFELPLNPHVMAVVKQADRHAAWCEAKSLLVACQGIEASGQPDDELLREVPMASEVRRRMSPELAEQAWLSWLRLVVKSLGGRI